jgi:hypothetical protein
MDEPWTKPSPWADALVVGIIERMTVPQVVLPSQVQTAPSDETPETHLLRSLLLSAITEYLESLEPTSNRVDARERARNRQIAESWFAGDPGASIEFATCCRAFGMAPAAMLAKIARLAARHTAKRRRGERRLAASNARKTGRPA